MSREHCSAANYPTTFTLSYWPSTTNHCGGSKVLIEDDTQDVTSVKGDTQVMCLRIFTLSYTPHRWLESEQQQQKHGCEGL